MMVAAIGLFLTEYHTYSDILRGKMNFGALMEITLDINHEIHTVNTAPTIHC
jgi:hypothetical protein